jgi:hypothetical protein
MEIKSGPVDLDPPGAKSVHTIIYLTQLFYEKLRVVPSSNNIRLARKR